MSVETWKVPVFAVRGLLKLRGGCRESVELEMGETKRELKEGAEMKGNVGGRSVGVY